MKRLAQKYFQNVKINSVIQFMTYSDVLLLSGWGLIMPILAVFITEQVDGGTILLAGMASTVYLFVKSVLQIPVARLIDMTKGDNDDFWVMISGSLLISLCGFLYLFVSLPWHVIAVQIIYGVAGALSFPAWQAIFTRHIDKREEGLEWSLYFTATDLGAALSAVLGGAIAQIFGYKFLFLAVGILSLLGTLLLGGIYSQVR